MFSYMKQSGAFYRRLALLSIPTVIQYTLNNLLTLFNSLVVSTLGETSLAAVTMANIPFSMLNTAIFGVQSGTMILVSQFWGKKDKDAVSRIFGVGAMAFTGVVGALAVVILLFPTWFFSLFGNEPEVIALAAEYGKFVGISEAIYAFDAVYMATMMGAENPSFGTMCSSVTAVVNLTLNYVLINGFGPIPALGIRGSGIATLVARVVELSIVLCHMFFNKKVRIIPADALRPGMETAKLFIQKSGFVVLNECLWSVTYYGISTVMSHMSDSVNILAAYSVANNIDSIINSIAYAMAAATATITAMSVGSGEEKKVTKNKAFCMLTVIMLVNIPIAAAMFVSARYLGPAFIYDYFGLSDTAAAICTTMIYEFILVLPFRTYSTVIVVGIFRGGGDTVTAALIDVLPLALIALPFACLTGLVFDCGIAVVMLSYLVDYLVEAAAGTPRLLSGNWIKNMTE